MKKEELVCRCGCGLYIENDDLLTLLQQTEKAFGRELKIVSGTRCKAHNVAVGGSKNSAHLTGEAADIACDRSGDRFYLVKLLMDFGAKRIGIADRFIHVDVSKILPQKVIWLY